MSKFAKVMVALLAIAAFAAPAFAADNFSVSGTFLTFGTYTDADAADDSTDTFANQKLRVYGIFKANDNVSVHFRTDMSEGRWDDTNGAGRSFSNSTTAGAGKSIIDLDRAFMEIKLDSVDLRAGTQFVGFGKSGSLVFNNTALSAKFKGEMPITLAYGQIASDNNIVAANVGLGAFNVFGGLNATHDASVYMVGASYQATYDAINVVAEADIFTGEVSETVDAAGLTAFVDASMAVSDTLTAGGAFYFAASNDDADKQNYSVLGQSFGTWDAFTRGPFADENYLYATRPYEAFGVNAGVIALQGYGDMKVNDSLKAGASLVYAMPGEEDVATADSAILLSVYASYDLAENVKFNNGVQYVAYDSDAASGEALLSVMTGLTVNF